METPIFEFVLSELDQSQVSYKALSAATGVPKSTIHRIASRETSNPRVDHVQRLYDYFQREAAA